MKKSKEMSYYNEFLRWILLVFVWILYLDFSFCLALNHEGNALLKFKERVVNDPFGALSSWKDEIGEANPCSWFGVGCADGHVVSLNLKNLCLDGTLAPELHKLLHIKSIILRNNSFSGFIPDEITYLKELQLLDLGYNNFDVVPPEFGCKIPSFLLDNTGLSCHTSAKNEQYMMLSEVPDNDHLADVVPYMWSRHNDRGENDKYPRRLLQGEGPANNGTKIDGSPEKDKSPPPLDPLPQGSKNSSSPPPSNPPPPPSNHFPPSIPPPPSNIPPPSNHTPPSNLPAPSSPVSRSPPNPPPSPNAINVPPSPPHSSSANVTIIGGVVGGAVGLVLVAGLLLLYLLKSKKIRKAGSWGTGLSGQLQKAFVAGIPNLKRSELESACEDFSNVIGSSSLGTIYKGTLSNGVEIAVITLCVTSAKDWSKSMETQFRNKIEALSRVNHKNFVNLIGYCEEEDPFTRLMVFEYAPNGSLFEHLHVREAEHLDWLMRLRVAMGLSYCLEHMHQLTPPVIHPNLNSSAVSLSEDYAAKVSEFCFWNEVAARQVQPMVTNSINTTSVTPESNVLAFGLVLLEMMTGRNPHSTQNSLNDWVLEYIRGELPLQEMVDPMLRHFDLEQLDKIGEVIRKCLHTEQNRPTMRDVTTRLKEVTGINQDKAAPRFSSLWWAELESRSANGS